MTRVLMTRGDPAFIAEWNANLQAKRLRDLGLSYPAIAIVVAEYHGIDKSQDHWRAQLRKQGAGPVWRGNGRTPTPARRGE